MIKYLISILAALAIVFSSSLSLAEVTTYMNKMEEGYGYEFDDDPLNAGGFGDKDMLIKVRPRAARATLIRPRTSFVYEMIKSIEDI